MAGAKPPVGGRGSLAYLPPAHLRTDLIGAFWRQTISERHRRASSTAKGTPKAGAIGADETVSRTEAIIQG